jgi:hypothetical protein
MRPRPTLVIALLIAGMVLGSGAEAAKWLFELSDPAGDGNGDGSFVFPESEDLEPGDLDLVAICLTPRPQVARSQLRRILIGDAKREIKAEQGTVRRDDMQAVSQQVAVDIADSIYFPDRVRVSGPKLTFFVPSSFLGAKLSAGWSWVVAVSATSLMAEIQTQGLDATVAQLGFDGLMILPVRAGGSRYTLGSTEPDVEMLPPLVDLMVPQGQTQEQVLRSFDVLAGKAARLPGVVPQP